MENKTFESALNELETIVKELESGDAPLDKAIEKYTKGMELAKFCNDKITDATDKVNKILTNDGKLEDFEVENESK